MKDRCELKKLYTLSFYQKLPKNDLNQIGATKIMLNPCITRHDIIKLAAIKYPEAQIIKVMDDKFRYYSIDVEIETIYNEQKRQK